MFALDSTYLAFEAILRMNFPSSRRDEMVEIDRVRSDHLSMTCRIETIMSGCPGSTLYVRMHGPPFPLGRCPDMSSFLGFYPQSFVVAQM